MQFPTQWAWIPGVVNGAREAVVCMWPWASSAQQLTHEDQVITPHWHIHYNINVKYKHGNEQQHFKCMVNVFLKPRVWTLSHFDVYIVFSSFQPQGRLYSAWGQPPGKAAVVYMRVRCPGTTHLMWRQKPKVFSIHHCQDFAFIL